MEDPTQACAAAHPLTLDWDVLERQSDTGQATILTYSAEPGSPRIRHSG